MCGGPKWIPGSVIQDTGPLSARVELQNGTVARRHHDQVVTPPAGDPCPGLSVCVPNPMVEETGDAGFFRA